MWQFPRGNMGSTSRDVLFFFPNILQESIKQKVPEQEGLTLQGRADCTGLAAQSHPCSDLHYFQLLHNHDNKKNNVIPAHTVV